MKVIKPAGRNEIEKKIGKGSRVDGTMFQPSQAHDRDPCSCLLGKHADIVMRLGIDGRYPVFHRLFSK
ncbi:MAG: hypothetical protein ACREXG_16000, partial [Polaromonas sp.]